MSFLLSQYSSAPPAGEIERRSGGAPTKIKLSRNDTSFPMRLLELFKETQFDDEHSFLKYYQNIVRFYVGDVDVNAKGLLVNFTMGMGKSIMAVALAIELMDSGYEPVMLMSKSLQGNMKQAIVKYVRMRAASSNGAGGTWTMGDRELDQWISTKFSFVSLNASNMIAQMSKATLKIPKFDKLMERELSVLGEMNLSKKVLIIDEAHNFFRSIVNGGKNALGLYDKIMKTRDMKLIFLTGTPINNSPFELVPCYNMLAGEKILPESWSEFKRFFIEPGTGYIKNCGKFQNRILGLTSYVSHTSTPGAATSISFKEGSKVEFPEEKPLIIEHVKIHDEDWGTYQIAREREKEEENRPSKSKKATEARLQKPKKGTSSSYRVRSRQYSNYVPPPLPGGARGERVSDISTLPDSAVRSAKLEAIYTNLLRHDNQLGLVYSQFTGIGGLGILAKFLELRGWTRYELNEGGVVGGLIEMYKNIEGGGTPLGVGFTSSTGGVDPSTGGVDPSTEVIEEIASREHLQNYPAAAAKYGTSPVFKIRNTRRRADHPSISRGLVVYVTDINGNDIVIHHEGLLSDSAPTLPGSSRRGGNDPPRRKTFALITGEVDPADRDKIQAIFNADANKRGGAIDLLLISSTGAEGLDLKNIRHIHVMDPYWNWARIAQVIARGVRNNSHVALPEEERNVQPYMYLAVKPDSSDSTEVTTDVELYERSIKSKHSIDSFTAAVQSSSIECALNKGHNCRMCNPTDVPLFSNNIMFDIERAEDPCHTFVEKTAKVTMVMLGDKKYYYSDSPNEPFGIIVYEFNDKLKSYTRMSPASDIFKAVVAQLGRDEFELPDISV